MSRFKTIVYEEVTVYDVTYQEWIPPEEKYDGGDGLGSCTPYRRGFYRTSVKKGLTQEAKTRFLRGLRDVLKHDRGPATIKSRKTWKKISEEIIAPPPPVATRT